MPDDDELISVPKEQLELLVLKSNMELLQRVNKLIDMIERYENENCD